MPYKSLAQARKFHADPRLRQYAAEFDKATDFSHLPWRTAKKHRNPDQIVRALAKGNR